MARLAAVVKDRRKVLGLTQLELARLSGCGSAFLWQLEHAKPTVRMDKLLEVLAALGLRLEVTRGPGKLVVTGEPL